MKTAFVFPGQGAQYIGMAMDFVAADPALAELLNGFDAAHGTNLMQIMQAGPEESLKETRFTQPAILFHSYCALKLFLAKTDIKPDFVAGHSLGEFTALVANGMLTPADAMHIVHKRGEFMIRANAGVPFAMAAIIGLDAQAVIDACNEASEAGIVLAVNFNTPIQTVISGSASGVQAAGEIAKAKGAKRVLPLVVGGPFHTPLIHEASQWLATEMSKFPFANTTIPVVSNVDAMPSTDPTETVAKLERQIISPVRWVECIEYMKSQGVTRYIEFGPQKVLSGMIKNIDKDAVLFNIDKVEDIDTVLAALNA
ncbi:MAG: [acyl-carrier-protein] S-malonyltransferase [Candidatus Cloacimonetes bacterium HGW-Cloacimonetes-1]|jgi:[acyl-carrier-protein] S-malonyltransferase|nr:MAG: [acyl-carrier-protein] S-malonyltransferase [Candidatus Cloacimonetes bacterium HGW-Cloacimonetes-1]